MKWGWGGGGRGGRGGGGVEWEWVMGDGAQDQKIESIVNLKRFIKTTLHAATKFSKRSHKEHY